MKERYGGPVVCLDLVKAVEKHPREIVLRSEFDVAISYINQTVRAYAQQCILLCISGVRCRNRRRRCHATAWGMSCLNACRCQCCCLYARQPAPPVQRPHMI